VCKFRPTLILNFRKFMASWFFVYFKAGVHHLGSLARSNLWLVKISDCRSNHVNDVTRLADRRFDLRSDVWSEMVHAGLRVIKCGCWNFVTMFYVSGLWSQILCWSDSMVAMHSTTGATWLLAYITAEYQVLILCRLLTASSINLMW